jgi:DNA-directed RNA polymerase specialized sigma24 family protein
MKRPHKWKRRPQVLRVPEALKKALRNDWDWADEGDDPQISDQHLYRPEAWDRLVSPGNNSPDHYDQDEEEGADLDHHRRQKLLTALKDALWDALSPQERYVLIQRDLVGDTYEEIAKTSRPPLIDRSHARQVHQRARRKLRERLSRFNPL